MRLNPEESLEWLREYEPTPSWVEDAYAWIARNHAAECGQAAADIAALTPERLALLEEIARGGTRFVVWPVKTGRNRP